MQEPAGAWLWEAQACRGNSVAADSSPDICRNQRVHGFGKRSLPRKIILIRHAESVGNVDPVAYGTIPDSEIPLVRHHTRLNSRT